MTTGYTYDLHEGDHTDGDPTALYFGASALCPWCTTRGVNVYHTGACPRVQAAEHCPNGATKRVAFFDLDTVPGSGAGLFGGGR